MTDGFTLIDENATLTNKRYECSCNGVDLGSNGTVTNQNCSGNVSSTTFSKTTGFKKCIDTTAASWIFCKSSCTVTRTGSSWTATLTNGI